MGGIMELNVDLDKIEQEVESVKDTACKLNCKLVEEANYIGRLDKVSALKRLKKRLFKEIDDIIHDENIAKYYYDKGKLKIGFIASAADTFIAFINKKGNPLEIGLNTFLKKTDAVAPFWNIVAIFKDSINLVDVEIISISKIARERKMTEAMVIAGYKNKGYTVLTPEQLKEQLDKLIEYTKNNTTTKYLKGWTVAIQPVTYKAIPPKNV